MATARIRYVNPHSSGGNGTTTALSGANAAYASLQAALDAERGNLVTADVWLEIICATNGNADTVRVNQPATGWTTDATRYVHVKAAPGHRAGTQWATNKYRIEGIWDYAAAVYSGIPYFRIEGIQARNLSALAESKGFAFDHPTLACDIRLDSLLTRGNADLGIVCSGGTYTVRNCVSIGNGGYGFLFSYGIPGCVADGDNLTAVANAAIGIHSGSSSNDVTLRNCYSGGNGGDDYTGSWAWTALTTCYSEDGTASTSTAAYSSSSGACFASVVAGSQNVALMASSSLRNVGTDLSASFTTDITGYTRSGLWDIGAYEYRVLTEPTHLSTAQYSASYTQPGGGVTTCVNSVDVGSGANRCILVKHYRRIDRAIAVQSVTLGGESMAVLGSDVTLTGNYVIRTFALVNPTVEGTQDLVITCTTNESNSVGQTVVGVYDGVDPNANEADLLVLVETDTVTTPWTSPYTAVVPSAAGELAVAMDFSYSDDVTCFLTASGFNERINAFGGGIGYATGDKAGEASATFTWTPSLLSQDLTVVHHGFSLPPVPADDGFVARLLIRNYIPLLVR